MNKIKNVYKLILLCGKWGWKAIRESLNASSKDRTGNLQSRIRTLTHIGGCDNRIKRVFDLLQDSHESKNKTLKLDSGYETINSDSYPSPEKDPEEEIADSPESPDSSRNSDVFKIEGHLPPESQSITSRVVANYLEKRAKQESESYSKSHRDHGEYGKPRINY